MHRTRSLAFALAGLIGLAACSSGGGFEATFTPGTGGAGGGFGGAGGDEPGDTSTGDTTGSGDATTGAGGTGAGGDSSTSSSSSSSSSSSTGSGGAGCDYAYPNTCPGSEELTAIDGDRNNDKRSVKGTTSKWFKIRVNEAVSSVISYPKLSYTATLATPPGMDFDLFEYDGTTAAPSCSGDPKHAMGSPESVTDTWGDTVTTDDTRWITLEVRYISGSMCPSDPWTLTVEGHTNP